MADEKQKKPTNPKDALGIKKVPLHNVPSAPLLEVGLAMMEGGRKYGTHNYRVIGVRASTYYDAAWRHLTAWWEGEDIDAASGLHHVTKAIASLFVLRDAMVMDNYEDDRPPRYPNGLGIDRLNELAAKMIEKYPECEAPFLHKTVEPVETEFSGVAMCEVDKGDIEVGAAYIMCDVCDGSGKLTNVFDDNELTCPYCKGTGEVPELDGRNC